MSVSYEEKVKLFEDHAQLSADLCAPRELNNIGRKRRGFGMRRRARSIQKSVNSFSTLPRSMIGSLTRSRTCYVQTATLLDLPAYRFGLYPHSFLVKRRSF